MLIYVQYDKQNDFFLNTNHKWDLSVTFSLSFNFIAMMNLSNKRYTLNFSYTPNLNNNSWFNSGNACLFFFLCFIRHIVLNIIDRCTCTCMVHIMYIWYEDTIGIGILISKSAYCLFLEYLKWSWTNISSEEPFRSIPSFWFYLKRKIQLVGNEVLDKMTMTGIAYQACISRC